MQATSTIVRSWAAIFVGVFFTGVTSFVLTEDVFRHGAPFTTKHLMTLAVLAGTVYFGHALWRELRAWRLGTAFGCVALFLAGTATCVLMSAGRNAEVVSSKVLVANSVNTDRARAQKDRDESRVRYQASLKAEEEECSSGSGAKCQAKRITRMVRREEYDTADGKLREQKPEQIANSDIRAAAELVARLPLVTADVPNVEALLLLLFPFLQSLFCEIGAIVGYSIGVGHGAVRAKQLPPPLPKFPPQLPVVATVATPETDAATVTAALERAGRPVTNDELADLMGVSKSEASRRVSGLNGAVRRIRVGKYVAISLPEQSPH